MMKQKILGICEVVLLVTLIVARLLISSEQNQWISLLNYCGFVIAFIALFLDIYNDFSTRRGFNTITGVFILTLVVLIAFAALILSGVIIISTKCSDVILLGTLLITLPTRFYKSLIGCAFSK